MAKPKTPQAWIEKAGVSVDMRELCDVFGFGYSPGKALILERVQVQILIEELEECIDKSVPHPDFVSRSSMGGQKEQSPMNMTYDMLPQARERASYLDLQLMPYVHPKLTASKQEVSVTSTSEALLEALQVANEVAKAKA